MKQSRIGRQMYLVFCMVVCSCAVVGTALAQLRQAPGGQAAAQGAAGDGKAEKVTIRRVPPPNKTAMVRTPEYSVNAHGTQPRITRKPREWALFEIRYTTDARWTDELTFNYHVMTRGKDEKGGEAYSYYNTAVRYVDIPKGDHMSCVAIPPSQIERYGEPVAIALEVVDKNGTVADAKAESTHRSLVGEWWKNSEVMDSKIVTRRQGMVERSKTPFALINADDYEVVQ